MKYLEGSIKSYFIFDYALGFAIGLIIFCAYMFLLRKEKRSQKQSVSRKDILCGLALSIYFVFLLGGTILNRDVRKKFRMELIPFWSYYEAIVKKDIEMAMQILGNVLAFIPLGILLPQVWERTRNIRWIILSAVCVSLSLELGQLIFRLGLFEFDDVFHNTLGAMVGYGFWRMWRKIKSP